MVLVEKQVDVSDELKQDLHLIWCKTFDLQYVKSSLKEAKELLESVAEKYPEISDDNFKHKLWVLQCGMENLNHGIEDIFKYLGWIKELTGLDKEKTYTPWKGKVFGRECHYPSSSFKKDN